MKKAILFCWDYKYCIVNGQTGLELSDFYLCKYLLICSKPFIRFKFKILDSQTSNKRCIYIIVKGKSIKELQKNINEMIEQGWQSESGLIIRGWDPVGGVTFDGKWYLQSMIHCQ